MKKWQKIILIVFLLLTSIVIVGYAFRETPVINSLFAAANCSQSKQYGYYGFNSFNAVCNKAGISTSCGGNKYCCKTLGNAWTIGACVITPPSTACITEGKFATNAQKCCTGLTKYQETSLVYRCKKPVQPTCTGTCPYLGATCNSNSKNYCCNAGKQWVLCPSGKPATTETPASKITVNPNPVNPVNPPPPAQKPTVTKAPKPPAFVGCYDYACVSQAQGSLWGLVNCGVTDADGDMQLCDGKGRIGICQAQKQCCPGSGQKWTTDMTACPVTQATLTVTPTDLGAGSTLSVTWGSIPGPSGTDWLGMYAEGETNERNSIDWNYVNSTTCSKTIGDGKASGTCSFIIPATAATGTYELRLYSNNTYTKLAASNTFTIKGTTTGECCACPSPTPSYLQSMCNGPCMTSYNCPTGQVCLLADTYGWVCRNPACADTASCTCLAMSLTPTPTPRTTKVSCDEMCTSTSECKTGYQCVYMNDDDIAVCRNPKCFSSGTCVCPKITPTIITKGTELTSPTPVATLSGTPTPTGLRLDALPTPIPSPTPVPINPPLSIKPFTDTTGKAPQKFTLTGTSDPFTEIVIQFNPDAVGQTTTTDAKGNFRYILTKPLTLGNKDLTVTARAVSGGETQVKQAFTVKSGGSFFSLFIGFFILAVIGGIGLFIYKKQMNDQSSLFSQFPPISSSPDESAGTSIPQDTTLPTEEKPEDLFTEADTSSVAEDKPEALSTPIPEDKPPFSS